MTVIRSHLLRYHVSGYDSSNREVIEYLTNGRDAYIMESYFRRLGYTDIRIRVVS